MNTLLLQVVITLLSSVIICLVAIPLIIRFSLRFNLVDKPNERKVHRNPIPRLGGVGIFLSAGAALVLSPQGLKAVAGWPVLFSSVGVLFLVGVWDDIKDISARLRFMVQICCATMLAASGVRLTSLYGILGIHELQAAWQYIITVLIIVGATNAFNLIDGVDGLAGGLGLAGILVLGYLAWSLRLYPLVVLLAAFAGALVGFLRNNISPARIFMGDGGSLVLGYLISSTGILLVQRAASAPALLAPSRVAMLVTAVLIIPVFDTLRVFAYRLRKGISPFKADKTHIHHLFLVAGMNHRKTAGFLYCFELLLVLLALLLPGTTGVSFTLVLMVFLFHVITEVLRVNQGMEHWLAVIRKMEKEDTA